MNDLEAGVDGVSIRRRVLSQMQGTRRSFSLLPITSLGLVSWDTLEASTMQSTKRVRVVLSLFQMGREVRGRGRAIKGGIGKRTSSDRV